MTIMEDRKGNGVGSSTQPIRDVSLSLEAMGFGINVEKQIDAID